MLYPSIDKLLTIVDSKYKLVHVASIRSKQMLENNHYQMAEKDYKNKRTIGRNARTTSSFSELTPTSYLLNFIVTSRTSKRTSFLLSSIPSPYRLAAILFFIASRNSQPITSEIAAKPYIASIEGSPDETENIRAGMSPLKSSLNPST